MRFWKAATIQAVLFILFGLFLVAEAKPHFSLPRLHRNSNLLPPPMGEGTGRFSFDGPKERKFEMPRPAGKRHVLPRPHVPHINKH